MKKLHPIIPLLLGAGMFASAAAFAASNADLPPEHRLGDVIYRSGGVGAEEVTAMKQVSAQYPLELLFVVKDETGHNAYGAGDRVTIRNATGSVVLDTRSEGPFLLARLLPGKYTVEATHNGKSQKRAATVTPDQHTRLIFAW